MRMIKKYNKMIIMINFKVNLIKDINHGIQKQVI